MATVSIEQPVTEKGVDTMPQNREQAPQRKNLLGEYSLKQWALKHGVSLAAAAVFAINGCAPVEAASKPDQNPKLDTDIPSLVVSPDTDLSFDLQELATDAQEIEVLPTPTKTPAPTAAPRPVTTIRPTVEANLAEALPTVTPEPKPPVIEQAQVRVVYVPPTVNMRASTSTESAKVFADTDNTERVFKIVKDITVGTYIWYELQSVNKAGDTAYVRSDVATDVRIQEPVVAGPNTGGAVADSESSVTQPLLESESQEDQVVITSPDQLATIPATAESLSFAEGTNPDVAAIARILEKLGFSSEFSISVQESSPEHPIKYIYGFQTDIPEAQKLLQDNALSPQMKAYLATFIENFLTERGVDLSKINNMAVLSIHELSEKSLSNFYVQTTTTASGTKNRSPLTEATTEEANNPYTDFGMVISGFTDIENNPYDVVTLTIVDKESGSVIILTFDPVAASPEDREAELADIETLFVIRLIVSLGLATADSSFKLAANSNDGPSVSQATKNLDLYRTIDGELQNMFDSAMSAPLTPRR